MCGFAAKVVKAVVLLGLLHQAQSFRDASGIMSVRKHSAGTALNLTALVRNDGRCCCQKKDEDAVNNQVCVNEKTYEVFMYDEKRESNPDARYNQYIDIKRKGETCASHYGLRCGYDTDQYPTAACEYCISEIITLAWFRTGRGTRHAVTGSTVPGFDGKTYLEYNKVLLEKAPNQTKEICTREICATKSSAIHDGCMQYQECKKKENVPWCPAGLTLYRRIGNVGRCFSSKALSKTFVLFGKKTCPGSWYHRTSGVDPENDEVANSFCDCGGECL